MAITKYIMIVITAFRRRTYDRRPLHLSLGNFFAVRL